MSESLNLDAIKVKAEALGEEIQAIDPHLTIVYAVHHADQLKSTLQLLRDLVMDHPAGPILRELMDHPPIVDQSAFIGLAMHQGRTWLGGSTASILALVAINIEQYAGFDEMLFDLYHHSWHAIETAELCRRPEMADRLKNAPLTPKRVPMNEARANLRADVFAGLMMATDGYEEAPERLGLLRSRAALERASRRHPESFPFPTAVAATQFALRDVYPGMNENRSRIDRCADITREISDATNDEQIRSWWRFCDPAQDMAWRGYDAALILHTALNTSEDPYVRAIAHQVVDVTGHAQRPPREHEAVYNPYLKVGQQKSRHSDIMQYTLNTSLREALAMGSAQPLFLAANEQNKNLVRGRFIGWCAIALQAAGRAFDAARHQSGKTPDQAAQLEFETYRDDVPLEGLERMCREVVTARRNGNAPNLSQLPDLAGRYQNMDPVIRSLHTTLDDAGYNKALQTQASNDPNADPSGLDFEPITLRPENGPEGEQVHIHHGPMLDMGASANYVLPPLTRREDISGPFGPTAIDNTPITAPRANLTDPSSFEAASHLSFVDGELHTKAAPPSEDKETEKINKA